MPRSPTSKYRLRIVVLPVARTRNEANNEDVEDWPERGGKPYFASRESLSGGEEIAQGLRQSTGGMSLRIRGRAIPISASDRVKIKATGELYSVTGVSRDDDETIVQIERVTGQETPQ